MATKAVSENSVRAVSLPSPEALPADGFTRWKDLKAFVPLSREAVRLREKMGRFPKRVHLSQRCAAWPNRELHRWLADPAGYRASEAA